jgi:fatty acid desaturase
VESLRPASLVDDAGREYPAFRRALRPRWWRVGVDLAAGYAMLVLTAWLLVRIAPSNLPVLAGAVALGSLSFGYWMAYLQLFLHEAAHFNIAPSRAWNDRLANALIASWVGTRIESYRAIHWQHHRHHGDGADTERSYFSALDTRFLLEGLTGVSALRVILFRRDRLRGEAAPTAASAGSAALLTTLLLHVAIIGTAVASGFWWLAIAWLAGMGVFFPFFGALRQLLEHRSTEASREVDYRVFPHGRTTRMFSEGPLGSTLGGAGFTRHLLHHWDPSVSYTNLAEVEGFLRGCAAARPHLAKTSYLGAFAALYGR